MSGVSLTRRRTLGGVAASLTLFSGCLGASVRDVRVSYTVTVDKEPEMVPEDVRNIHRGADNPDGRRKEGHKWVAVEIDVTEGTLDMEDLWFRSRVETEDRFYDLDHASGALSDGIQSRGDVQEGGYAIALYQIPDESVFIAWDLDETHQDIDAEEE